MKRAVALFGLVPVAVFFEASGVIRDALKCDDARFRTVPVLRAEPRACVVVTLVDPDQGEAP